MGQKLRRTAKLFGIAAACLVLLTAVTVVISAALAPDYNKVTTPAGYPVNQSCYLELGKETFIWVSAWLPPGLEPGQRIPAIVETSRYGECLEAGWLYRAMQTLLNLEDLNLQSAQRFTEQGYAYVWVQSPGSCQSSGPRHSEYPRNEVDAIGLAIDWVSARPWSNQRVGAAGGSYSGTTAEMSAAALRPQLKAIVSNAPDWDPYAELIRPGGLGSRAFIETWGAMVEAMDRNDMEALIEVASGGDSTLLERWIGRSMYAGLMPPSRAEMDLFRRALKDHESTPNVGVQVRSMIHKDDVAPATGSWSMDEIALYNYKARVELAAVPTLTRVGWMDAGVAEGALSKFLTFDSPQILVIRPTGHRSSEFVNPFGANEPMSPDHLDERNPQTFAFFDQYLRGPGASLDRSILYYTYGSEEWRITAVWPPTGVVVKTWFFGRDGGLNELPPEDGTGADRYRVDFTATSGESNRWLGQMGRTVRYGDRSLEDEKLLHFTSDPMDESITVTGSPTVWIHLSSTHTDGAVYVYLEDVGPDGRVSYLTEGMLRLIHRRLRDPAEAPFVPLGVYHSFRARDAEPMPVDGMTEVAISLFPISATIARGHRIRIAIAGHDGAMVDRYPPQGGPVLTVQCNALHPSLVELPLQG